MSKKFKDWIESENLDNDRDYDNKSRNEFTRKDGKRYDKKKAKIQNDRRNKNKNRFSHFE